MRANGTVKCGAVMLAVLQVFAAAPQTAYAQDAVKKVTPTTATPIKNVIVIIGENRTFDHVFGTYVPREGQSISNLWSKGIVKLDGTPGPHFGLSKQYAATDTSKYTIAPTGKTLYTTLPPSLTGGAPEAPSESGAPFISQEVGELADQGLARGYDQYLTTGATGLAAHSVDTRITSVNPAAPTNGVYQLTGPSMPYDAYTSSPVHRLFQMWQQTDCSKAHATATNPSGCLNDLFPWVEVTIGAGSNGKAQAAGFSNTSTGEGSTAMGFYNMYEGDAPYFKYLADNYTINDNFHQSVEGGTGANHIMFGYGDGIYFSDGAGKAMKPPVAEIEDTDPQPGTNNYYKEDGYGTFDADGNPLGGGSYVDCTDMTEGGVPAVVNYLDSVNVKPRCTAGHYYLVNNYNPGYFGDGTVAPLSDSTLAYPFTIPPTSVPHIGDTLMKAGVSFKYYGEGWDLYVADPTDANPYDRYCNICNPFGYATSIMANPITKEEHIGDTTELYEDIATGTLPAVSIVKPSGYNDGHPASSKLDLFEGFVKKIVDAVQANPTLWAQTAIFITFDEGGGYYDSGYIQPVDFFGDGTRIPLIIVSPYSKGGVVKHQYSDHVSLLKFIELNWKLPKISKTSRDNFPDPKTAPDNPYVPINGPALADLSSQFVFPATEPPPAKK
jgi:phospholipase C